MRGPYILNGAGQLRLRTGRKVLGHCRRWNNCPRSMHAHPHVADVDMPATDLAKALAAAKVSMAKQMRCKESLGLQYVLYSGRRMPGEAGCLYK